MRHGQRYRPASGVATAPAGSDLLLTDLDRGAAYRLNRTARAMWDLLASGGTAAEVAEAVHERLGAPREQAEADAAELLADLLEEGLLEPRTEVG